MVADRSAIEWTDATWNPVRGCSRVSAGCENCYAERQALRFSGVGQPFEGLVRKVNGHAAWTGKIELAAALLDQPLRWREPRRIFVNSMSDLFHENVPDDWIDRIFAVMALCPQHTFQILTKRPERMLAYCGSDAALGRVAAEIARCIDGVEGASAELVHNDDGLRGICLSNVWLGVSVEDQAAADERIPLLLRTPAAVRFLSCEPLLGPVDLRQVAAKSCDYSNGVIAIDALTGDHVGRYAKDGTELFRERVLYPIRWVIAGGESGPRARPMHPDWARSLREQCAAAGVPFFFKQWGEWAPADEYASEVQEHYDVLGRSAPGCIRVGKKRAGHLLDGVEHHAFPEAST